MQANTTVPASKSRAPARGRVAPPPKDGPANETKPVQGALLGREQAIAQAAYYLAETEGFPPGRELEYWLKAEAEYEKMKATPKQ